MADVDDIVGEITDQGTLATDLSLQLPATHVGTASQAFQFAYNNTTLSFSASQDLIADAGLYAALNASSAPVTWSN